MKIDLDSKTFKAIVRVGQRFVILRKYFKIMDYKITEKETKNGKHITIRFKSKAKFTDSDLVFLQLWLGSDWKREFFNYLRVRAGWKNWNVLFKRKFDSKMRVLSEER